MRSNGDGTFVEVSAPSGMASDSGMSASWADYDADGDMDILLTEEMRHRLHQSFQVEEFGVREIRGFGKQRLYRLLGSDDIRVHN